ncbi:MAG: PEP/pyruvate-binding domain-containing protein [Desulfomonilaceae bacterium]
MGSERLLFWFEEMGDEHNDIVGKKCANLGRMIQMGLDVPPGFAISIDMYRKFIRETGAAEEISQFVDGFGELKGQGITVFDEISETVQNMIETKEMPEGVKKPISSYYDELCQKVGIPDVAVSVRSAGTESRPGMFETYLNVKGKDDLFEKIRKVWASAYTTRAVAFRVNKGLPVLGDELGIAVPKMVNARSSGICFTVDPVTGDDSKIILEANWGLGEGVVSGVESVDGFIVDKESLQIVTKQVGRKTTCVVNVEKGAAWVDVPKKMQSISSTSDEEVIEIAKVAKSVETKLGCPQDMEWAIDSDLPFPKNIFWLQTRPAKVQVTTPLSVTDQIIDLIVKRL